MHIGTDLRLLVVIASYGTGNDEYLRRTIAEYRSSPFLVDIVVVSNIAKDLGAGVEVIVGLPDEEPRSLPFAHQQIFANRITDYDVFIYSEDDMLVTESNIKAFLEVTKVLPSNEIAGFFRYEEDGRGQFSYPDVIRTHHWDPGSVRVRGSEVFAFFTNEHAASYIVTREQLQHAVASGHYLLRPHQGKYDLQCSAATDIYTQCGFTKVICISRFRDFLIHHLANKYVNHAVGISSKHMNSQLEALMKAARNEWRAKPLLSLTTVCQDAVLQPNFYEPVRTDVISRVPQSARNVLSIGCGWGATEVELMRAGKRVVVLPLDSIISACARSNGLEVVEGDLRSALAALWGQQFDCILVTNILHLLETPHNALASLRPYMADSATVITVVPNVLSMSIRRKLRGLDYMTGFAKSGAHFTFRSLLRYWLSRAGFKVQALVNVVPRDQELLETFNPDLSPSDKGIIGFLKMRLSLQMLAIATSR